MLQCTGIFVNILQSMYTLVMSEKYCVHFHKAVRETPGRSLYCVTSSIPSHEAAHIFPRRGSRFPQPQVRKDWELGLGVIGDVFFQSCQNLD